MVFECEKSPTGFHEFVEERRYNGERWHVLYEQPDVVEERARCTACGHIDDISVTYPPASGPIEF